ncbi:hypothetical protein scyTo_0021091 [Scyliorhinus torazame]|uniref:Uncharacterized protein n=1 Tax=Scyliorhinus torazame TaxID=75743 RepID=A0A401PW25_SCYTO|nr:hypothetical protein [Scyliorhinus torazame]
MYSLMKGLSMRIAFFSSVPAKVLSRVLPPIWEPLCESLRKIASVSVAVVNLEYKGLVLPVWGFGHLIPSHESSEILGVVYDSCSFPQQDQVGPPTTRLTVMMGGSWFQESFGDPDTASGSSAPASTGNGVESPGNQAEIPAKHHQSA